MNSPARIFALLAIVTTCQSLEAEETATYERAMSMLAKARSIRNADARNQELLEAADELNKFLRANPEHEKFGLASNQLGMIRLERARELIWESRSSADDAKRKELQEQARVDIVSAKKAFQQAHDNFLAIYKQFPAFIPAREKSKRAKRFAAEVGYMRAQLNLAQTRYEEAQTYDHRADGRAEILLDAGKQFERIHEKYRSMIAGLIARMWQGKCFEERDDISRALGIYNEVLSHGGSGGSESLQRLQDRALRFRLTCLNHDKRRDYQLVVQEGEERLSKRKSMASTRTGLGIRWELARAYEALATKPGVEESEASMFLKKAFQHAKEVAKFPNDNRASSRQMITRIQNRLGGSKE